jgi:outer membrane protein assembly factor BamE (lipoprotein component of BamABCDE complex)
MKRHVVFPVVIFVAALFFGGGMPTLQGYEGPLPDKKIASYSNVAFTLQNFQKVQKGMTQEKVLELLGVPEKIKEEKRRHDRWTVHYFYPDGHVVNFKNGLVVGKE